MMGSAVQKVRRGKGEVGLHRTSFSPLFVIGPGPTPFTHESPEAVRCLVARFSQFIIG